jgi:hypothetical protein
MTETVPGNTAPMADMSLVCAKRREGQRGEDHAPDNGRRVTILHCDLVMACGLDDHVGSFDSDILRLRFAPDCINQGVGQSQHGECDDGHADGTTEEHLGSFEKRVGHAAC